MNEPCNPNRRDVACGGAAFVIWGIPIALLVATAYLESPFLVVIWPILLLWMGGACLVNARRCGRRHCFVTGPFFLMLAGISLLYGLGLLNLGLHGWKALSSILLVGSCILYYVPEWIWGRYMIANPVRRPLEKGS